MATPPQHQPQAQYVAGWEINIRRILLLPTRVVYSLHLKFVLYSAPVGERSIAMSVFVCLSENISPELHVPSLPTLLRMLSTAVA